VLLLAGGCGSESARVYDVPKEQYAFQRPAAAPTPAADTPGGLPKVAWDLPAGWEERPASGFRAGSFAVAQGERTADVSIIPLPGAAGSEADNVNRWRGEVGLSPLEPEAIARQGERVAVGSLEGRLFDMTGSGATGGSSTATTTATNAVRTLAAFLERDGVSWFFKMRGEAALVAEQRAAFVGFLKTIRFEADHDHDHDHAAHDGHTHDGHAHEKEARADGTSNRSAAADPATPNWEMPAGWQPHTPVTMALASFVARTAAGETATITVTGLPGPAGGVLANVNRWRGQLGLGSIAEAGLASITRPIDGLGGKATLVEFAGTDPKSGQPAVLVAAIVVRGNQSWFYKMVGDSAAVNAQRENFTRFVQGVRYPDA
jgi:hypothetical protein